MKIITGLEETKLTNSYLKYEECEDKRVWFDPPVDIYYNKRLTVRPIGDSKDFDDDNSSVSTFRV